MIKTAGEADLNTLVTLAVMMWDTHTVKDLEDEFLGIMKKAILSFFLLIRRIIQLGLHKLS